MLNLNIAKEYAGWAFGEGSKQTCNLLKRAVERFNADVDNPEVYYLEEEVEKVITFVENLTQVTGGEFAGKKLILQSWQKFFLVNLFGLHIKKNDDTLVRKYRTATLWVARKNGKSTFLSAIALYLLCLGEAGGQIFSAATTKDQARIIFDESKRIARSSPGLIEHFNLKMPPSLSTIGTIECTDNNSFFRPLSRDGKVQDGLNISCGLIDEIHAHKTAEIYEVIVTGTGSRREPIILIISTAGFNQNGVGYSQYNYSRNILNGDITDDSYFCMIYELDSQDEWQKPDCWVKANPNLNVSLFNDNLQALYTRAKNQPSEQNNFLVKHCNVWTNTSVAWLRDDDINTVTNEAIEWSRFSGLEVTIGLDFSTRQDITAISVFAYENAIGKYICKTLFFIPGKSRVIANVRDYPTWIKSGYIYESDSATTDFDNAYSKLIAIIKDFELEVTVVAVDSYQSRYFASKLENEGYEVVEYKQSRANYSEAMKQLESVVIENDILIDKNPVMRWMLRNCENSLDDHNNYFPKKVNELSKIDGVVSMLMAVGVYGLESNDDGFFDAI